MENKPRILVTGHPSVVRDEHLSGLVNAGFEIDRCSGRTPSNDELIAKLPGAVGYLFGGFEFLDSSLLQHADKLKVVSLLGEDAAGFLDLGAAKEMGLCVTNTPGATTEAVSQFVLAEVMFQLRGMTGFLGLQDPEDVGISRELSSVKIGIVGLGRIGRRVSRIFNQGFGSKILYWNRTRRHDLEADYELDYQPLDSVVEQSDFLIVAVASHDDTEGLISKSMIEQMKPGASLICVSKSRVLDLAAISDALVNERILSVFIDWLDVEYHKKHHPDFDGPSLRAAFRGRFVISPHIANDTKDSWERMASLASASMLSELTLGESKTRVKI